MNVSFLFWNLNHQPVHGRVASLVLEHGVDIVMLAECAAEPAMVCRALTERGGKRFYFPYSPARKLLIFTSFPESSLLPVLDDPMGHVTVRRFVVESRLDILLAVAHLQSKYMWGSDDQFVAAGNLARDIATLEDEYGHRRTVLVGDLNMNPFDKGVVAAGALHAVMARKIAAQENRTVDAKKYPFFYNPMWGYFGDRTDGPPGSYYYRKSTPVTYFWNIYDQVLLRPDLMHSLNDLRILDAESGTSLLSRSGIPDSSVGSDHLPLYFRLSV